MGMVSGLWGCLSDVHVVGPSSHWFGLSNSKAGFILGWITYDPDLMYKYNTHFPQGIHVIT